MPGRRGLLAPRSGAAPQVRSFCLIHGGPVGPAYFEPKTRSNSAVSPAVWNLMSLPSAL
jgi:hypothetical protein